MLSRNVLRRMIFGMVIRFYRGVQLFFAIAGECFGFLVGGHGAETKVNYPAKLCKKKNKKSKYGELVFQNIEWYKNRILN
jgi:hypothetical protein